MINLKKPNIQERSEKRTRTFSEFKDIIAEKHSNFKQWMRNQGDVVRALVWTGIISALFVGFVIYMNIGRLLSIYAGEGWAIGYFAITVGYACIYGILKLDKL
jgi:hypothetical protein